MRVYLICYTGEEMGDERYYVYNEHKLIYADVTETICWDTEIKNLEKDSTLLNIAVTNIIRLDNL